MKILLINNFHYRKGGSESVYFNTADILRKNGHEVIFFSTIDEKNISCRQSHYFTAQNSSVLKIKGVRNFFFNTDAKCKLEELIVAEKPDIAHVHLFWGGISPSIFDTLHKHHIPLIHTAHDYRMVCPAYTFKLPDGTICEQCKGKHFYKCATQRCSKGSLMQSLIMSAEMYVRNKWFAPVKNIDGFVFVSRFSYDKHQQYLSGLTNDNSVILYNTTPRVDDRFTNTQARKYFLFFGRLSHEKGVGTLIKTFLQIPNAQLLIVGTGPEEASLRKMVADSNAMNIEFAGYKNGDDLKSIICNASFIVVPSEWYENNPMTIVESYTMGVPVIGSRIGGIPEIIEEGKTGYTFTPKDSTELCGIIERAIALSHQEYMQMSDCARQFAINNFDEQRYYITLMDFYNKILKRYGHI